MKDLVVRVIKKPSFKAKARLGNEEKMVSQQNNRSEKLRKKRM